MSVWCQALTQKLCPEPCVCVSVWCQVLMQKLCPEPYVYVCLNVSVHCCEECVSLCDICVVPSAHTESVS